MPGLKVEGKKITDQQTIAETCNEYFIVIAENVERQSKNNNNINYDNDNIDSHTHFMEQAFTKPYPSVKRKCTTTKEIERIIKSLKKNSYGYAEISTKILKISCPFISSLINYICNEMLFWGIFPDRLKYAVIKPLHKNYDRSELSNYGPVSLLTLFSKIFETVMQIR